jgi:ABC-2 type transport system permease protein
VFRVEWIRALRRPRSYVLAGGLVALTVLLVVSVKLSGRSAGGPGAPAFLSQVLENGFFVPLAAMAVLQPFFLPLGAGLLSGDSVAGEASAGTLRYLLVRPVGRVQLVLVKYGFVMFSLAFGVGVVIASGLIGGGIAFGFGPLPTLSGTTLATAEVVVRMVLAAAYVLAGVSGLVAIGMFASVLVDSPVGAAVVPVAVAIASQILDHLDSLRVIHPYLISHQWLAFVDLFRSPVPTRDMALGVLTFAIYTALFLGAAVAAFVRRDVSS